MRRVAAVNTRAERARRQAQQLVALPADRAFAAAYPWIGDDLVADIDPGRLGSERDDLAGDLVPHRERQGDAARFQRNPPAVAEIEMPVPDMHVAIAYPGGLHPQYDFRPPR